MPKVKDFEKDSKVNKKPVTQTPASMAEASAKKRRRPGRDTESVMSDVKVVIVDKEEELRMDSQQNSSSSANETLKEPFAESSGPKVEIRFPGSEILRAKFSKPFEVAEGSATDWVNDGKFEGLPLGHPLAQYFAAKGLQKAKKVEKQVLESPVTEKVVMQALQAGMKAQEIIAQVRAKVKK